MKKILFSLLMFCCMTSAWAQEDGFVDVATTIQLWNAIKDNPRAKVRLTADFALSDINKDYELYCNGNTFCGTIDGNGHTIKGDPKASVRARTYMFYNCSGATFKNLTFKGIRVNSQKNPNQAIITAKAMNHCVFENITFDNVHTFSDYDNAAAAAGWAQDCTFSNITVKNSDFTVDETQSGAVVGHAIGCTFTNIKVENCESTAHADGISVSTGKAGGVAGRTDNCTINNVEILGCFIKTDSECGGGVVGYSENTRFANCIVDDQSCVCVDGSTLDANAGGIVGYGWKCNISNCINSALIAADLSRAAGIVGSGENMDIVGCLNTGMVIDINMSDVKNGFYNKYKTKTGMTCVIKTYQGKEYVIRKYDADPAHHKFFAGIAGKLEDSNLDRCVNWGSVYGDGLWMGGIVGYLEGGKIRNCLSDFSGSEDVYGICLFESYTETIKNDGPNIVEHDVSIYNCLNMTTYKDFAPCNSNWTNFSGGNNYSLTTATKTQHLTKTTYDKVKSGEICLKLGANWEQNLGTDESPTPTGSKGVYHTRTVSNQYGTVCFPFPVQSDDNIRYYTFSKEYNGDDEVLLMFDYAEGKIPAGTPLLFRVRNLGENCFNNVAADSNDWADEPISKDNYDSWDSWNFLGTFYKREFSTNAFDKYYVSDGVIKNAKQTTVPAYRAYFRGPDFKKLTNSTSGARVRIVVEEEDGETTAISLINENYNENENFGGKAYSLMGTEVNDSYRGIVIRNGKKYINR